MKIRRQGSPPTYTHTHTHTHTHLLFLRLDLMAEATSAEATGKEGLAEAVSDLRPAPLVLVLLLKESRDPLSDSPVGCGWRVDNKSGENRQQTAVGPAGEEH